MYDFLCHTLLGVQQQLLSKEKSLSELVKDGLESLIEKGLLRVKIVEKDQNSKITLAITRLGKAAYKGKMSSIFHQTCNLGFICIYYSILSSLWKGNEKKNALTMLVQLLHNVVNWKWVLASVTCLNFTGLNSNNILHKENQTRTVSKLMV